MDEATAEYRDTPALVFGPNIKASNGNIMSSKAQTQVNISPYLSKDVQHGYIFNDTATGSLISIDQLCSNDCIALFSKYKLKIIKNNMVIIKFEHNQNR